MQDVQISTSIPEDVAEDINRMAKEMMISRSAVVRQLLAKAVRNDPKKDEVPA